MKRNGIQKWKCGRENVQKCRQIKSNKSKSTLTHTPRPVPGKNSGAIKYIGFNEMAYAKEVKHSKNHAHTHLTNGVVDSVCLFGCLAAGKEKKKRTASLYTDKYMYQWTKTKYAV